MGGGISTGLELTPRGLELKERGNKALEEGNLNDAIACYSYALEAHPRCAVLWNNRAIARAKAEKYEQAFSDALEAIELAPTMGKAYFQAGRIALCLKRPLVAVSILTKGVALLEGNEQVQKVLEEAKLEQEKHSGNAGVGNVVTWSEERSSVRPKVVEALRGHTVTSMSCGLAHTVVVTSVGDVLAWGSNACSECGQFSPTRVIQAPLLVPNLIGKRALTVACGAAHTLITTQHAGVWGWGLGGKGQLGTGTSVNHQVPIRISTLDGHDVRGLSCGLGHSVARTASSDVLVFGWNNVGQLGLGGSFEGHECVPSPTSIDVDKKVAHISCGGAHTIITFSDGTVASCGSNSSGQLGLGTTGDTSSLQHIPLETPILKSACGEEYSVFLTCDHTVLSCGLNNTGQLGQGNKDTVLSPQPLEGLGDQSITNISCGQGHAYAISSQGQVYFWGLSKLMFDQLGMDKTNTAVPRLLPSLKSKQVVSLNCGRTHFVALLVATDPDRCYFTKTVTPEIKAGKHYRAIVQAVDDRGNKRTKGGEALVVSLEDQLAGDILFEKAHIFVHDNMDGTYECEFVCPWDGKWYFNVLMAGKHIQGSPVYLECGLSEEEKEQLEVLEMRRHDTNAAISKQATKHKQIQSPASLSIPQPIAVQAGTRADPTLSLQTFSFDTASELPRVTTRRSNRSAARKQLRKTKS
mmetsp:Transcript_17379/g.29699  ORF Transcript_17379/g.29699 Transcript_17379/m.29699 type:complete len:693 (+) Transcript_17379:44-2122(+)